MQSRKDDPLSLILERPGRRSRAEFILRELVSSSYNHSLLGNLIVSIAQQAEYTSAQLTEVAGKFEAAENSFNILDFIRCIEVRRSGATITVVIKSLKTDLNITRIEDSRHNHEFMGSGSVELPDLNYELPQPEKIAELLLASFYNILVRYRKRVPTLNDSTWFCREKTTVIPGAGVKTPTYNYSDVKVDYAQAIELVTTSLRNPRFHLILTHDTFMMQDQNKRLWGMNRDAVK